MSENNAYVYGHYKADTGELFYIGKGTGKRAWTKSGRSTYWSRVVNKHKFTVKLLHENLTEDEAFNKEIELIADARHNNIQLVNVSNGGNGLTSADAIALNEKNKNNPEWIRKIKESRKKLKNNSEFQKKVSEGCIKRSQSEDWRKNHAEVREKLRGNPEFCKKVADGVKKKYEDVEWRKERKKMYKTPEWIRKNKEGAKKRLQHPELRRKLSEAAKKRWQDATWREQQTWFNGNGNKQKKKSFKIISPDGTIHESVGIGQFCRDNQLTVSKLSEVISGKRKHHKGWRLYTPEENYKISEFL
jgi:hypothetical protein